MGQVAQANGSDILLTIAAVARRRYPYVQGRQEHRAGSRRGGFHHHNTEKPLGEAAAEAIRNALLQSREKLFVTLKEPPTPHVVVPLGPCCYTTPAVKFFWVHRLDYKSDYCCSFR